MGNEWQDTLYMRDKKKKSDELRAMPDIWQSTAPSTVPTGKAPSVADLTAQYLNREAFSYDPNRDEDFLAYADLIRKQGKNAMEDTVGRASSMTGGYGNSYAATAGQQVYNQYFDEIDSKAIDYRKLAREEYDAEGADLLNKIALEQNNEDRELSKAQVKATYGDPTELIELLGIDPDAYNSKIQQDKIAANAQLAFDERTFNIGQGLEAKDLGSSVLGGDRKIIFDSVSGEGYSFSEFSSKLKDAGWSDDEITDLFEDLLEDAGISVS